MTHDAAVFARASHPGRLAKAHVTAPTRTAAKLCHQCVSAIVGTQGQAACKALCPRPAYFTDCVEGMSCANNRDS